VLLDFFSVGYRRLLPTIMAAAFAISGTKNSEWMAALQKMHVPNVLLVPLAVLFRFFPTLVQDFKSIRQAMRFRGISLSAGSILLHPLQSAEYFLIPLLMSAEKTATELSATALVRGLASETPHTTVHELKLRWWDGLVFLALCGFIVKRMWLG
jgi:energy-coupling factor transport system permease protein